MNPFTTALIKAPKRARFDFNHSNTIGMRVGALTPTECRFIVPGDDVSVSMEQIARLAPMPVPTFVNLKVRHDWFFVPLRLLYGVETMDRLFGANAGGVERACVQNLNAFYTLFSGFDLENYPASLNAIDDILYSGSPGYPLPGSLFDYLGYPVFSDRNGALSNDILSEIAQGNLSDAVALIDTDVLNSLNRTPKINIERLFAYHFIWRDWYRFTGIDNDIIVEPYLNNGILGDYLKEPRGNFGSDFADYYRNSVTDGNDTLRFGNLGQLKYAHLTKDMFTSARYGSKPTVLIPTGNNGTIPALREASAIQRFIDILSITGQRYFDKVKGLFGVEPEGPKDDRVQFLARYQQYIKVGEVLTTATTSEAETGDYAGRGILIDGKYLFKRHFSEHGYLMCISSIIPDVAYSGLSREITDVNVFDSPIPTMAQVGDQTIYKREVRFMMDDPQNLNNVSFGDQFRYYAYKSAPSEVHGFFLMDTARPWSPLIPSSVVYDTGDGTVQKSLTNVIDASRVYPASWNFLFNDTSDEFIFGDRFFFNIDFYMNITRALPKYINYHL